MATATRWNMPLNMGSFHHSNRVFGDVDSYALPPPRYQPDSTVKK
jgi:hypothetical protein